MLLAYSRPRTITKAEECWAYNAADVDKVRKFLNGEIYKAFDSSPQRMREKEDNLRKTTQCIRMSFPRYNQQDALVQLDMAFDHEIAKALFPSAWDKFISVHGPIPPQDHTARYPEAHQCK
jgi:hypothetical protein